MTNLQFEKLTNNTKEIGINKVSNMAGNFNMRFYDFRLSKWIILSFKTYSDAVTLAFMAGFINVKTDGNKLIVLERGFFND